ncbi:Hypothetical predicted protein [Mytilus galloprovincialis]|uniref:B box-type domain-containing protein n=1 Tax=Mytilus galloprovincialis TaxID=29158 RepID=A0A8B6GKG7_MYTGA|nr:Hypothetical predicted protein [Mytilus galloprovincialis]
MDYGVNEPLSTFKKYFRCDHCEQEQALKKCFDCELLYCIECVSIIHSKGKLQTHKIKDISCEKIDICQQCNKQNAELECEDCELSYCQACSDTFHRKGALKNHTLKRKSEKNIPSLKGAATWQDTKFGWYPNPKNEKSPCKTLPTTCPNGYTKLTNQSISPNCYLFGGSNTENRTDWHVANAICTSTPGVYLWIPDSREEAVAVLVKFDTFGKLDRFDVFTGANNLADRNSYVYAGTNDIFDPTNLPYGIQIGDDPLLNNKSCFELEWDLDKLDFEWDSDSCSGDIEAYVCEFPIAEACN